MSQNKVMYAYFATVDRLHRLEKSLNEQRAFGLNHDAASILIIDYIPKSIPNIIRNFFKSRIYAVDPYVRDEHGNRAVCLPKLRNEAIFLARKSDVEWLFFCDVDTVITKFVLPEPDVKYAFPYVYWQKTAEETVGESLVAIDTLKDAAFSEGNSWFLLSREAFEHLDFNEHIIGYGWEDYEFNIRALAIGLSPGRCKTHVVHVFHSQEERAVLWWQFKRNEAIFEAVQLELDNGFVPDWRQSKPIGTQHPAWMTHLYFDFSRGCVMNPLAKTLDPFEAEGNRIIIRWKHWPAEVFEREGVFLKYRRPLEG